MITEDGIKLIKENVDNINFRWLGVSGLRVGTASLYDINTRTPIDYVL